MTAQDHVTNPGSRRTASRRKMQDKWRRSPRWKALLEEHAHTNDARCVYCGRKHHMEWQARDGSIKTVTLTINHTSRHLYASEDLYLTWDPRYMEIVCVSCNRQYERGMKPCPECLKKGKMTYILDRDQECWPCYYEKHPEEKRVRDESRARFDQAVKDYNAKQATRRRAAKVRHPCTHRRISGACGLSTIGSRCQYSPTKALRDCEKAEAKKAAVS